MLQKDVLRLHVGGVAPNSRRSISFLSFQAAMLNIATSRLKGFQDLGFFTARSVIELRLHNDSVGCLH